MLKIATIVIDMPYVVGCKIQPYIFGFLKKKKPSLYGTPPSFTKSAYRANPSSHVISTNSNVPFNRGARQEIPGGGGIIPLIEEQPVFLSHLQNFRFILFTHTDLH